jgi:hypothetical protein
MLQEGDVFVYCGHNGGEQYLPSDDLKVRAPPPKKNAPA